MHHFNWRGNPCKTFREAEDGSLAFISGMTMAGMSEELRKVRTYIPNTILSVFPSCVWWMCNELSSWHRILQGLLWQLMLALPGFHLFSSLTPAGCWATKTYVMEAQAKVEIHQRHWKVPSQTVGAQGVGREAIYTNASIIDCIPSLMLPEFLPYKWLSGERHITEPRHLGGTHMMSATVVMTPTDTTHSFLPGFH